MTGPVDFYLSSKNLHKVGYLYDQGSHIFWSNICVFINTHQTFPFFSMQKKLEVLHEIAENDENKRE